MNKHQKMAQDALDIQDAVNIVPVVRILVERLDMLSGRDTMVKRHDCIVRMVVSKLEDLTGIGDTEQISLAYAACKKMANG